MIPAARALSLVASGAGPLLVAFLGGGPGHLSLALGLLLVGAAARLFGAGDQGWPSSLRPWIPAVAGLALGLLVNGGSLPALALAWLAPLAGLLAFWPEKRSGRRAAYLALAGGILAFLGGWLRLEPRDSLLACFWAAAFEPAFPRLGLGLWASAFIVGLRGGLLPEPSTGLVGRPELLLALIPVLLLSLAAYPWPRKRGDLVRALALWILPALLLRGWPPEAFFPLALSLAGSTLGRPPVARPSRPLWVLPSSWDPVRATPNMVLGPGRVLAGALALGLATLKIFNGSLDWGASLKLEAPLSPAPGLPPAGLRFRPADFSLNLALAEEEIDRDAYKNAEAILDRLRPEPNRPPSWWRVKGRLAARSGDLAGGLVSAGRAVLEDPGDPRGYATLGRILIGIEPALALRVLRAGLAACPEDPALLKSLAQLYEGLGRARAALPLYQAALGLEPRDTEALRGVCRTAYVRAPDPQTRAYLNRLRRLAPNDPWVHRYLQRLDEP